jgi:DNA-binding protein H-NS
MENFLKLVTNRNTLKSLTKNFYLNELEKFANHLEIIINQRKEKEAMLLEQNKEKIKNIEHIKEQLSRQGLTVNDLLGDALQSAIKNPVKVRNKVLPKYRLSDSDGTVHDWTGRGITPKVFQQHFDRGYSKESLLIVYK